MRIHHVRTLDYYDGPQVFEARDNIGGRYIAVMGNFDEIRYLVAGVPPPRLDLFCNGLLDLRGLLEESVDGSRYTTTTMPSSRDEELALEPFEGSLRPFLPEPGLVLDDLPSADLEVPTGDRPRLELKLDASGRIDTTAYIELLNRIQMLVKHTLSEVRRARPGRSGWRWRDGILDVVTPALPGSFRVLLESSSLQGPAFSKEMVTALRRVDTLFEHAEDVAAVVATVRENRGRIASSYLKLLQLLDKNATGLRYAWAQEAEGVRRGAVSRDQAGTLVEVLSRENLEYETVELIGELYRCNRGSGYWGMSTDHGQWRGWVRPDGPELVGLRLGGQYRFTCDVEYDLERRRLYLIGYEPLQP